MPKQHQPQGRITVWTATFVMLMRTLTPHCVVEARWYSQVCATEDPQPYAQLGDGTWIRTTSYRDDDIEGTNPNGVVRLLQGTKQQLRGGEEEFVDRGAAVVAWKQPTAGGRFLQQAREDDYLFFNTTSNATEVGMIDDDDEEQNSSDDKDIVFTMPPRSTLVTNWRACSCPPSSFGEGMEYLCPADASHCGVPYYHSNHRKKDTTTLEEYDNENNAEHVVVGCYAVTVPQVVARNAWPLIILWFLGLFVIMTCTIHGYMAKEYVKSCCWSAYYYCCCCCCSFGLQEEQQWEEDADQGDVQPGEQQEAQGAANTSTTARNRSRYRNQHTMDLLHEIEHPVPPPAHTTAASAWTAFFSHGQRTWNWWAWHRYHFHQTLLASSTWIWQQEEFLRQRSEQAQGIPPPRYELPIRIYRTNEEEDDAVDRNNQNEASNDASLPLESCCIHSCIDEKNDSPPTTVASSKKESVDTEQNDDTPSSSLKVVSDDKSHDVVCNIGEQEKHGAVATTVDCEEESETENNDTSSPNVNGESRNGGDHDEQEGNYEEDESNDTDIYDENCINVTVADNNNDGDVNSLDEPTCTICFVPLEEGDRIGDLSCGHQFHVDCLKSWLTRRNACPLCARPMAKFRRGPRTTTQDDNTPTATASTPTSARTNDYNNHSHRQPSSLFTRRRRGGRGATTARRPIGSLMTLRANWRSEDRFISEGSSNSIESASSSPPPPPSVTEEQRGQESRG